jgi:hypothetical protein
VVAVEVGFGGATVLVSGSAKGLDLVLKGESSSWMVAWRMGFRPGTKSGFAARYS